MWRPAWSWAGLGDAERAGHAVGRLHVGDAEDVVRVRHGLVEQKVVQPSTKIVSSFSSSATGPSAGVLPLE